MQNTKPTPCLEWASDWVARPKRLYIEGRWVDAEAGRAITVENPARGTALAMVAEASAGDVERAARAAREAFAAWRKTSRRERATALQAIGRLVRKHASELATLESLNNGKTFAESSVDDLPEAADVFDYYAGWTDKIYGESVPTDPGARNSVRIEPVGVCALVVPWNFPLLLACWKIAPALAMGNTILVKPSPFTPLSLVRLVELIDEAKILPRGALNLILGGTEAGQALAESQQIDKISFTGSTEVGKAIVRGAAANLKSVTLELGGKSPNIVFEDAENLPAILDRQFSAMFSHKGEKCTEPTRLVLHRSHYNAAVEQLVARAERTKCGDPFDASVTQGPQCHRAHFEKVLSYIELGKQEGARLLVGGTRDPQPENGRGYFVRPTIFADVRSEMRIAREEIFGPVLAVISFDTEEEAIRIANDTPYGLAAGLYTSSLSRAERVTDALDAGMIFVNHYGCYDFASPFGGFKQSGWGKEMAAHSLDSYTRRKSVWTRY